MSRKPKQRIKITVGDKIVLTKTDKDGNKLQGTIRFIGNIVNKQGIWYGIELNQQNKDITTQTKYFECDDEYKSLFVKKKDIDNKTSIKMIKKHIKQSKQTTKRYYIHEEVSITELGCNGTIKYIGFQHHNDQQPLIYYGIALYAPFGDTDGKLSQNGTKYFQCYPRYGLFCKSNEIGAAFEEYNRYDLLFVGFSRSHIDTYIFPSSLIKLCIDFLISTLNNNLIFWSDNKISMRNIGNIKHIKDRELMLSDVVATPIHRNSCLVSYNIHDNLQRFAENKFDASINSVLFNFECGKKSYYNATKPHKIRMVFFNSLFCDNNVMNGYCYNYEFEEGLSSYYWYTYQNLLLSLLYNNEYNHLIVSGYENTTQFIDLNIKKDSDEKAIIHSINNSGSCMEILSAERGQYFMSGNPFSGSTKCFQFNSKNTNLRTLSSMNYPRSSMSSCLMKYHNRIIVALGTGLRSNNIAEIYDIKKNKWIILKGTINDLHENGIIWIDDKGDNNLVFVAGPNRKDCVEFRDLRSNKNRWQKYLKYTSKYKAKYVPMQLFC